MLLSIRLSQRIEVVNRSLRMHLVRDSASVRITDCKDPFVLDFAQASKDLRTSLTTVYDPSAASSRGRGYLCGFC